MNTEEDRTLYVTPQALIVGVRRLAPESVLLLMFERVEKDNNNSSFPALQSYFVSDMKLDSCKTELAIVQQWAGTRGNAAPITIEALLCCDVERWRNFAKLYNKIGLRKTLKHFQARLKK